MSRLAEIRWIDLPGSRDDRGVLTSLESGRDIPFPIKRIFYMHHVVEARGGHAHIDTDQVLIAISGTFIVDIQDRNEKKTFFFNNPEKGLFVPRLLFTDLYDFSPEAVCLVLASTHYDRKKSLRSWDDFLKFLGEAS
jgi:dTDP-4-dehydrorhamnose 3,5-epimerase-like enzyme